MVYLTGNHLSSHVEVFPLKTQSQSPLEFLNFFATGQPLNKVGRFLQNWVEVGSRIKVIFKKRVVKKYLLSRV